MDGWFVWFWFFVGKKSFYLVIERMRVGVVFSRNCRRGCEEKQKIRFNDPFDVVLKIIWCIYWKFNYIECLCERVVFFYLFIFLWLIFKIRKVNFKLYFKGRGFILLIMNLDRKVDIASLVVKYIWFKLKIEVHKEDFHHLSL